MPGFKVGIHGSNRYQVNLFLKCKFYTGIGAPQNWYKRSRLYLSFRKI